jgi:putative (di)nucleoside polyphosphate hydrolase
VIDEQGFRANIGIILCNQDKQLLWARRVGQQDAWQFPQGGIREEESPEQALYRELHEEIGLREEHVEIIASTRDWLSYLLPEQLIRHERQPLCIGQKQRWYLLRLTGADQDVRLDMSARPEFDQWRWVDFWHPLKEVVSFKHEVYESALKEFEGVLFPR